MAGDERDSWPQREPDHRVRRLVEAWNANGYSAAVINAIKDEELQQVPPATDAVN